MKNTVFIYAGRLERMLAYLIDTFVLLAPSMLFSFLGTGIDTFATFLLQAFYFTLLLSGSWQASLGQRLLNIYVVKSNGRALTQRDALERFLAFYMPVLPLHASFLSPEMGQSLTTFLMITWYLPILLTENRVGVHDVLCNTRVVVGRIGA